MLHNKLNSNLKNIDNVNKFKAQITKYFLSNAFYSVDEYLNE